MSERCNRVLGDFYFPGLLKWQTWGISHLPPEVQMHKQTRRTAGRLRATTETGRMANRLRRFAAGAARAGLRLRLAARAAPCRNPAGFALRPDAEARFAGHGIARNC